MKCLKERYSNPKNVASGSGYLFKASVGNNNVTITIYKKPSDFTPKMNLQGNKESLRTFVCTDLPQIYRNICDELNIKNVAISTK